MLFLLPPATSEQINIPRATISRGNYDITHLAAGLELRLSSMKIIGPGANAIKLHIL